MTGPVRYVFAGDRAIAVRVLEWLVKQRGERPLALLVSDPSRASHADALRALCPWLPDERVLAGKDFRTPAGLKLLRSLDVDYVVGVHFPYIVPPEVLELPRIGVLNLHPAALPWNRGWHTPSWAILDGTPAGATLHFMDAGLDTGDIVRQETIDVSPADTAHTLYGRILDLELDVFRAAWPDLAARRAVRIPQPAGTGSEHRRNDLMSDQVRRIDLAAPTTADALLRRLRALTTSDASEAAWFEADGRRYAVRVEITPHDEAAP